MSASSIPSGVRNLVPWALPVAILLVWEAASQSGLISERVLPAPSAVVAAGWHLAASGELWVNMGVSAARAATGLAIGGAFGFVLGLANGLLPCGMVYAALALAVTAGHAVDAAAVMATFGVATTPALVATLLVAGRVSGRWRQRVSAALPLAIAATGVLLIVRGFTALCH